MGMNLWTSMVDYTRALSLFFFPCFFVCTLSLIFVFPLSFFVLCIYGVVGLALGYPPPFGWLAICLCLTIIHTTFYTIYHGRLPTYFVCHLEEIEQLRPLIPKQIILSYELNYLDSTKSAVNNSVLAITMPNTINPCLSPRFELVQ